MSRTKEIDFRRITFSLPASTLDKLRVNVDKGNMSRYVADLIEENVGSLNDKEESTEEFIKSLTELAINNSKHVKAKGSSLEILREIRYGGKY